MSEKKDIQRTIRLPASIWEALDEDAARCRRSSVRQLEQVLAEHYKIDNVRYRLVEKIFGHQFDLLLDAADDEASQKLLEDRDKLLDVLYRSLMEMDPEDIEFLGDTWREALAPAVDPQNRTSKD